MSEVDQIEDRIKNLSPKELARLREWFAEFDAQAWDQQLETDSKAGKLNHLIESSLSEHNAGKSLLV
ncbi:MAG TPA: hypothetical protein DCY89_04535 [Gammaproteobacteria bacterium]|nr:hypothetical protein [Gammaproteobacteria bacterium]